MKFTITIIGDGAASVAALYELENKLEKILSEYPELRIIINIIGNRQLEVRDERGYVPTGGFAYGTTEKCHILNFEAKQASPIFDDEMALYNWLQHNQKWCQKMFPDIDYDFTSDPYPPRVFVALYLRHLALFTKEKAAKYNITINFIHDEAQNVIKFKDDEYKITTKNSDILTNTIILATGHLPSSQFQEFWNLKENFCRSPLEDKEFFEHVAKVEQVCIIGTRLVAIDAINSLTQRKHTGKIILLARQLPLLPIVVAKTEKYNYKYLTLNKINALSDNGKQPIPLEEIKKLFFQE